jgi:hypothetical protein
MTLHRAAISFLPPENLLPEYQLDYKVMQENMNYGVSFSFVEILDQLHQLRAKFRS